MAQAGKFPLHPIMHDASAAPAVDTSPQSLGYSEPETTTENDPSPRRTNRISNAVEKLGRSLSGKVAPRPESPTSPSHRRMFSLNRKGKGRVKGEEALSSSAPSACFTNSRSQSPMPQQRQASDDSPFITPPSPTLSSGRPSLNAFRGAGSMRAGTQTLIQVLQAIPWTEDPDQEEETLSDEDERWEASKPKKKALASSIHTIHRPVARSMRLGVSEIRSRPDLPEVDDEPPSEEISQSDDETPDFEDEIATPLPTVRPQVNVFERGKMSRSGSMATVRLQRRSKLATKLKEVFELDAIEEVRAEMPCWLLRSVLLQGYMYLTNSYLCFFAHMPAREDQVLKSGSLNKKAQRTKRWVKHWFVLKNDALSWYQSSSDPYFPHGIVDLRYAISCEAVGERGFRLRTHQKTVNLTADSIPSREEWVKAIRKVIFKAQNMGDSVKIAIPYSAILDVEKSQAMDFSDTIEVKVYDKEASDHYSVDSYFFAYFHDISGALEQIRDAVRLQRTNPSSVPEHVLDTTSLRSSPLPERPSTLPTSSSSTSRFSSLLKPFSYSKSNTTIATSASSPEMTEEFTHVSRRVDSASFVPVTTSGSPGPPKEDSLSESSSTILTPTQSSIDRGYTYPPSASITSSAGSPPPLPHRTTATSVSTTTTNATPTSGSWLSVPGWLKATRPKSLFGGSNFSTDASTLHVNPPDGKVQEMYSSTGGSASGSKWGGMGDLAFSVLETPDMPIEEEAVEKFRSAFAYDEKETLLGYFPGYIFRLLPVYGRLYISTNHFCFKSTGPLNSRTRMTLPIRDILSVEMSKATRFGHHGLIVIIKGHEELFFEFGAEDKRDAFVTLLERQMEDVRRRIAIGDAQEPTQGERDALILEECEPSLSSAAAEPPMPESMSDSLPAVMFTSASSTFLTFKPQKSLHFTFLTIGSRGDVQPYISLAKGLKADGHRVRIATHGEFKEWIESHGIEFGYVGGDPAELMRICVENGTFTVAFLKEGLLKFRGWLDDLLKTSWEACQGTDVLVESPSAMGGYHIAEALGIPYFRAFTMTWTRTRAYPHAFAVPERKMGGGYNYMSYVMFDQVFWRAISGQINRWRRNVLQLGSTSLDKMEPHKIPFLYNFSPHVVPPPLDWPEWIRVTGYWFLDDADVSSKKWTPPADLLEFIDNSRKQGKKVVYIGFGSIVVSDPRSMTRCVIDAIVQSGVHAILSKGWSDRLHVKASDASEPEEPLPKQIYPISSIPHDWLFQRIDAACHHGGAGTTGASLRAGIPTIIKPFFGDQFFWADRVEALGVGTGVRKLTVDSLAEALLSATTDTKQIDRARILGEEIRAENGVATAIESIYRDLEYAKSLIKKTVSDTDDELSSEEEEDGTIRRRRSSRPPSSGYSSSGSARGDGAPSEDWSVISDQDDRRSSLGSEGRRPSTSDRSKRTSIAAAMLSVLPDSFPGSPRRRTVSTGSRH